jgi:hypothetical protein
MKIEQTECSETLAIQLHTLKNNPKENIWHDNGSLENRRFYIFYFPPINISAFFSLL